MANLEVDRLINNAIMRLPGAVLPAIQQELFMVMNEFFQTTNLWSEDVDIAIPANDPAGTIYQVVPAQPGNIDKLLWVFEKSSSDSMARGSQVGAAMSIPGELTLRNQPSAAVTYTVTVALTVNEPTDKDGYVQFPLWILQKHGDDILDGLLSRMMTHPNKPYTNTQMSIYHGRKFSSGMAQGRVEWTRNNTYRQQAWRFPGMARGSQKGRSSGWAPPQ